MNDPTETDPDVIEIAAYFAGKNAHAVADDVGVLDTLIKRASALHNTLGDNGSLGWRCCVDRCLARETPLCRACEANRIAGLLVSSLQELQVERQLAANLAVPMRIAEEKEPW